MRDAIRQALVDAEMPVVTEYETFVVGLRIVREGKYRETPIKPLPRAWDRAKNLSVVRALVSRDILVYDTDFVSGTWRVVEAGGAGSAEEACCLVDPFCYVSHLSAMQHYGLTERSPLELQLTTPDRPVWSQMRDAKVTRDLGEGVAGLQTAPLHRIGFNLLVRRRPVRVQETRHPARPIDVRGQRARITSIGRTFLDMLDAPALCGGMAHVLDVWDREAEAWVEEIIEAVDEGTTKIVKVRAGYILEERLGIRDPRIDAWKGDAQRGSSRKLDPEAPYAPVYSGTWMISLNV